MPANTCTRGGSNSDSLWVPHSCTCCAVTHKHQRCFCRSSSGVSSCEISWTSWAVDSRDGETDRVVIDGVEVWSAAAFCRNHEGAVGEGWELGPNDFPNPYEGQADGEVRGATNTERPSHCRYTGGHCMAKTSDGCPQIPAAPARQVCLTENVVVVDCSGTLAINFLSGIDQEEADESWAFSNLQVIGSQGETVLLDETRNTADDGAVATGWSNGEITNVGSAGNVHGA